MTSREAAPRDLAHAIAGAALTAGVVTPAVRGADWRLAVVDVVNADGTVDCGTIRARRLEDAYRNPTVGDTAVITQNSAGNWLAIGRTATTAGTGWQTYTPLWTASGTDPTLGNGTLVGRYMKVGRVVVCHINLIIGSATSLGSGSYSFTIPVTSANSGCSYIGHAHLLGSTRYGGQFVISPNAGLGGPYMTVSNGNASLTGMTGSVPVALVSPNALRITVTYEANS